MTVSFDISVADRPLVSKILIRAKRMVKKWSPNDRFDGLTLRMDLTACHANGCPLDFRRLLAADDFNFAHDVFGINRHINRDTGQLNDHFWPRCALKTGAAA